MHDIVAAPETLSTPVPAAGERSRKVGIEIEFMGPGARTAAEAIARDVGGSLSMEDPHAYGILGTRLGDMRVETDLRHVHPRRRDGLGMRLRPRTAALLGDLLSPFVPRELVMSPVPIARLPELDGVMDVLRTVGARGRGTVLLDSLGLHLNIDPPRLDARTVTAYLKAFLVLEERLRRKTAHGSWRLTLALPPSFPQGYTRRVLDHGYWPCLGELTDDYLAANPTRDRALDLLPLLAWLDEGRVRRALPHEKIGPRPAFHYRLPQAHLSDPGWSLMPDWERWLLVEGLASELGAKCGMKTVDRTGVCRNRIADAPAVPFDIRAEVEHVPAIMPSFVPFRRGLHRAGNLIAGN